MFTQGGDSLLYPRPQQLQILVPSALGRNGPPTISVLYTGAQLLSKLRARKITHVTTTLR